MPPIRTRLAADRWHFQHGPIDLVIDAEGDAAAVAAAHQAAWQRFSSLLDELVSELPVLRRQVDPRGAASAAAGFDADPGSAGAGAGAACPLRGVVAARMWHACRPFAAAGFITPMAAVAGAVADELIAAYQREGVGRAWVDNGGDIALQLRPGESLRVGTLERAGDPRRALQVVPSGRLVPDPSFRIRAAMPIRGVATSGWRRRSFSLGIADSVTVLARSAAEADAAATVIANAVDLPDARIVRRPARELQDDSDLGVIPVTVDVPPLGAAAVAAALRAGLRCAEALRADGLIAYAALACQGVLVSTAMTAADEALGSAPAALPAPACQGLSVVAPSRGWSLGSAFA